MKFKFVDSPSNIEFEYCDQIPNKSINLRLKGEATYKINVAALHLYGFYRNSIFQSYKEKILSDDIKDFERQYIEKNKTQEKNQFYSSPLYHYAIAASLNAAMDWKNNIERTKCYLVFKNELGIRTKIGFIHFFETTLNDQKAVYIAQAGVLQRGCGLGRHLMECVISHYPINTKFYIVTRNFNTDAINLYKDRLSFQPLNEEAVKKLGYNSSKYLGFEHSSTEEEIVKIKSRQMIMKDVERSCEFKKI